VDLFWLHYDNHFRYSNKLNPSHLNLWLHCWSPTKAKFPLHYLDKRYLPLHLLFPWGKYQMQILGQYRIYHENQHIKHYYSLYQKLYYNFHPMLNYHKYPTSRIHTCIIIPSITTYNNIIINMQGSRTITACTIKIFRF
jgi:hypothetical protein